MKGTQRPAELFAGARSCEGYGAASIGRNLGRPEAEELGRWSRHADQPAQKFEEPEKIKFSVLTDIDPRLHASSRPRIEDSVRL